MDGGQAQAQVRPAGQLANLIRPEQVSRLPHLTAQQKQQTEVQVQKYWDFIHANSNNQGDPRYHQAQQALAQLSGKLMAGMKAFNVQRQQQKMAQQQTVQNPQVGQPAAQPAQSTQPQQPPRQQAQTNSTGQAQGNSSQVTFNQLMPDVQAKVNSTTFHYPPAMTESSPAAEQWLQEAKARYGQAIQRGQMARSKKAELLAAAQRRQDSGNPLTTEERNGLTAKVGQCDKAIRESENFMAKFRDQQEQFKTQRMQQRFPQPGPTGQPGAPSENVSEGPAPTAPQMQQNAQGPQAHSISSAQAAARANSGSVSGAGPSQPGSATITGSQSTPIDTVQTPFNAQSALNSMPQGPMSRPSTAAGPGQAAVHPTASMQASHAHPNSAVSAHPVNAINGHKAHPPPIPKNLNVADPQAVQMPAARPTLNGGAGVGLPGQLAQPALTQFPGYVLEQSEDGHLLSKKKLQELVREVLGPNSEDQLTPEAEEVSRTLTAHQTMFDPLFD